MRELRTPQILLPALLAALLMPVAAGAATLEASTFSLSIGALPAIPLDQAPSTITGVVVSSTTGGFTQPGGMFAATGVDKVVLPTALFTGVSLISSLNLTASNGAGAFAAGAGIAGGFGGTNGLVGQSVVGVLGGLINLVVPLANVGSGGNVAVVAAALAVTVTGTKWTTGQVKVTGITTTVTTTTTTTGGAQVQHPDVILNTLTMTGYDNRTVDRQQGNLMLVSPVRILTNAAGNLPSFAIQILKFVPEPSRMLMLISAAAGLWTVGRLRMRR